MNDWEDYIGHRRETFINEMVTRGFRLMPFSSPGASKYGTLTGAKVRVDLDERFPYTPPKVVPTGFTARSWHREGEGHMCLYTSADAGHRPWLNVDAFLARVELWFTNNDLGWPDDPPALDLEAYLAGLPMDTRYIVHSQIARYTGDFVVLHADRAVLRVDHAGRVPKKTRKPIVSGFVTTVGRLTQPFHSWEEILEASPDNEKIARALELGRLEVVLVRYQRGDQEGVVTMTFPKVPGKVPTVHLALSASEDRTAMDVRSGTTALDLANKHVYLIGAGALGSHVADLLVRAGLGNLTIRDGDIFTPANAPRHILASKAYYGAAKATAVAVHLRSRTYNRTKIMPDPTNLINPADVIALLKDHDLVIDATADGAVTAMLTDAAEMTDLRFITACLMDQGRTMRVDVIPPFNSANPIPFTAPLPAQPTKAVFEPGCGEPISRTPPHAVAEAAAITARHAIGHLTGQPPTSAGEVRQP